LLNSVRAKTVFVKILEEVRTRYQFSLVGYVLMPEHVHLLIWPTSLNLEVSDFLSSIKQSVAKRARNYLLKNNPSVIERLGGHFHFWQDGPGYDRNIESDAVVWHEIQYIHMNPVRRGLCQRSEEWRWSSAAFYAGIKDPPVAIDRQSLPADLRK